MPGTVIGVPPAEFGLLAVPFNAWTTTEDRAMGELEAQLPRRAGFPGAFTRDLLPHALIITYSPTRLGRPQVHASPTLASCYARPRGQAITKST